MRDKSAIFIIIVPYHYSERLTKLIKTKLNVEMYGTVGKVRFRKNFHSRPKQKVTCTRR